MTPCSFAGSEGSERLGVRNVALAVWAATASSIRP
jgi:hypothetical protein